MTLGKKMCTHLKSMNKRVGDVVKRGSIVLDGKNLTPRGEKNRDKRGCSLQENSSGRSIIYVPYVDDPKKIMILLGIIYFHVPMA